MHDVRLGCKGNDVGCKGIGSGCEGKRRCNSNLVQVL